MIRRLATLCFVLLLLFGAPLSVFAQNATPGAGNSVGPAVGTTVSWIGNEGSEVGKITIKELTDPFQEYDPSSPPQRGFHYVILSVTIENPGARPLSIDPSTFSIVDQEGYVARYTSVYRPSEATTAEPDLQYADLAPGDSVTGVLGFLVLNGVTIERVVFTPDSSRLITLVDQRTAITPGGTTVPIIGAEGGEVATVTVNQVLDPFDGYDQSSPPQRGQHFVVLDVDVKNTGLRALQFDPSVIVLVDKDGFIAERASIYRTDNTNPPDLAYGELPPGASTSGYVGFSVLDGTTASSVIYGSYYYNQQMVILAEAENGKFAEGTIRPPVQPTVAPTAAAANPECQALVAWFQEGFTRLIQMSTILAPIQEIAASASPVYDSANVRSIADQVNALADQQQGANTPETAKALNQIIADTVHSVGSGLNELADAVDAKDDTAIKAAQDKVDAALSAFDSGGTADQALQPLIAGCPALGTIING